MLFLGHITIQGTYIHSISLKRQSVERDTEEVKKEKNNEKLEDAKNFFVESDRVDQL